MNPKDVLMLRRLARNTGQTDCGINQEGSVKIHRVWRNSVTTTTCVVEVIDFLYCYRGRSPPQRSRPILKIVVLTIIRPITEMAESKTNRRSNIIKATPALGVLDGSLLLENLIYKADRGTFQQFKS